MDTQDPRWLVSFLKIVAVVWSILLLLLILFGFFLTEGLPLEWFVLGNIALCAMDVAGILGVVVALTDSVLTQNEDEFTRVVKIGLVLAILGILQILFSQSII